MSTTPTEVLAFPNIKAIISDNGTAEVVVAGNSRVVPAGESLQDLRDNALALVVAEARTLQRPVRVRIEDPEGHGELIVHPDGNVESVSYEPRPARHRTGASAATARCGASSSAGASSSVNAVSVGRGGHSWRSTVGWAASGVTAGVGAGALSLTSPVAAACVLEGEAVRRRAGRGS